MWLLKHGPRPMNGLMSIAGFDCFYKHVPGEVLPAMKEGLHTDPKATMRNFWAMCDLSEEGIEGPLDTGALRGAGDTVTPLWAAGFGNWALRVPLALLLVRVLEVDVVWVWSALIADHLSRAVWITWLYRRGRWKTRTLIDP